MKSLVCDSHDFRCFLLADLPRINFFLPIENHRYDPAIRRICSGFEKLSRLATAISFFLLFFFMFLFYFFFFFFFVFFFFFLFFSAASSDYSDHPTQTFPRASNFLCRGKRETL